MTQETVKIVPFWISMHSTHLWSRERKSQRMDIFLFPIFNLLYPIRFSHGKQSKFQMQQKSVITRHKGGWTLGLPLSNWRLCLEIWTGKLMRTSIHLNLKKKHRCFVFKFLSQVGPLRAEVERTIPGLSLFRRGKHVKSCTPLPITRRRFHNFRASKSVDCRFWTA